jgi:hypothetical protein
LQSLGNSVSAHLDIQVLAVAGTRQSDAAIGITPQRRGIRLERAALRGSIPSLTTLSREFGHARTILYWLLIRLLVHPSARLSGKAIAAWPMRSRDAEKLLLPPTETAL